MTKRIFNDCLSCISTNLHQFASKSFWKLVIAANQQFCLNIFVGLFQSLSYTQFDLINSKFVEDISKNVLSRHSTSLLRNHCTTFRKLVSASIQQLRGKYFSDSLYPTLSITALQHCFFEINLRHFGNLSDSQFDISASKLLEDISKTCLRFQNLSSP